MLSLAAIATAVAEPVQRTQTNTSSSVPGNGPGSQLPTREPIGRQRGDPFAPTGRFA